MVCEKASIYNLYNKIVN